MAVITREQLTGAIKLVNLLKVLPREENLRALLKAEGYADTQIDRVVDDLDSYSDWTARKDLDVPPAPTPLEATSAPAAAEVKP